MSSSQAGFLRNAVAFFADRRSLGQALEALRANGIDCERLSLIAPSSFALARRDRPATAEEAGGGALGQATWTALGRTTGSGEALSSAGLLADDLKRLLRCAGDGLAQALTRWLPLSAAQFIGRQIETGQLVLWVHLHDALEERRVCSLLLDVSRNTVQVHDLRIEGRV